MKSLPKNQIKLNLRLFVIINLSELNNRCQQKHGNATVTVLTIYFWVSNKVRKWLKFKFSFCENFADTIIWHGSHQQTQSGEDVFAYIDVSRYCGGLHRKSH